MTRAEGRTPIPPPEGAQQLAVLLSPAVRVEPQLLRWVRLALLPKLDVGAESDLWFSDWVSSRSTEMITLDPAVRPHLYQRLSVWLHERGPVEGGRLRRLIERAHAGISPALRLEEEALWLALSGGTEEAINIALTPALRALVAEGRTGVADWLAGAWERLPDTVQQTRVAWQLVQVAVQRRPAVPLAPPSSPIPPTVGDVALIVDAIPDARIGILRDGPVLWLGDLPDATAQIMVPDTNPRVIELAGTGDEVAPRTALVESGTATRIVIGDAELRLRTGRGAVYRVAGVEKAPIQAGAAAPAWPEAPAQSEPQASPEAPDRPGAATRHPVLDQVKPESSRATYTLRLICRPDRTEQVVELILEEPTARRAAVARVRLELTAQDREDMRWYLEDYPEYPISPAPEIARRVEARLAGLGVELFTQVFDANRDTARIWDVIAGSLADCRIEIDAGVEAGAAVPWELLRDPVTDGVLALRANSFVRTLPSAVPVSLPDEAARTLRVLLVICRPGGQANVPFRSVASHLVRLSSTAREAFQLDVLRPPTFARLSRVLEAARAAGEPYHVVHFDGHGAWLDAGTARELGASKLVSPPRSGSHGFLMFEDPATGGQQLVDGPALGGLLARTGVLALVLNASRSAHAGLATEPETESEELDAHGRVRAYGSLAEEVMDAGVPGVVAMRYNVYVVTAAKFIGDVYASLLAGRPLGTAVTAARRLLAADPQRQVGALPLPLQDWLVPVVYEIAPLALRPPQDRAPELSIDLDQAGAGRERAALEPGLPGGPDTGFYGRDETLLAVDRAFDRANIVLLHAWAGAGKTAAALEFARWYQLTGAATAVLFTSFEHHLPMARLLDQIGDRFGAALERAGVQWAALDDRQRRDVAIQVLEQVPVLWIWDNVDPVAGFPVGIPSAWTSAEQTELLGLLRDLADRGQSKVLLASRRDERAWLGDLPVRVELPPMPMLERLELARAIADRQTGGSRNFLEVNDWRPLLEFTQGNPLTITILVRQILRERRTTRQQVQAFVDELRAGMARVTDDAAQSRGFSLAASLEYGFTQAFTEGERGIVALLALFQGFIDVDVLRWMGALDVGEPVEAVVQLDRDAGIALLDRAAEAGLLTAHGEGYYAVHPAIPRYLQQIYQDRYGPPDSPAALATARAWTAAIGAAGSFYHDRYQQGYADVIRVLGMEEANMLRARQLALTHHWDNLVIGPMQGLNVLYSHTGRNVEWRRLVAELVPGTTDPASGGPLPGHEGEWAMVNEYRVAIARHARDWSTAEQLERANIALRRTGAAAALAVPPDRLNDSQRDDIRNLAVTLLELGQIRREQDDPGCVEPDQEALALFQRIGDRQGESGAAFNLGHAYQDIPALRDLDQAERWYRHASDLVADHDSLGRARLVGQLGALAYERFLAARTAGARQEQLLSYLNDALSSYQQALELTPDDAVTDSALIHRQLGGIYREAGDTGRALSHYQRAIQYQERQDDLYAAGQTRFGAALALVDANRRHDALLYARAALRDYETVGPGANANAEQARQLIAYLEQEPEE